MFDLKSLIRRRDECLTRSDYFAHYAQNFPEWQQKSRDFLRKRQNDYSELANEAQKKFDLVTYILNTDRAVIDMELDEMKSDFEYLRKRNTDPDKIRKTREKIKLYTEVLEA